MQRAADRYFTVRVTAVDELAVKFCDPGGSGE